MRSLARSSSPPTVSRPGSRRSARRSRRSSSPGSTRSRSCRGPSCRTGRSISSTVCRSSSAPTGGELDTHAKRLLTAQVVAIASFLLFPLRFTFERPATDGVFGDLFRVLTAFDQPFNQAPSLHIALLVILWALFARKLHGVGRVVLHAWFALIGVSVLTTWQHHFIDLPTGALLGFFCLWLWPQDQPAPFVAARWTREPRRLALASRYAVGALAAAALAIVNGGAALVAALGHGGARLRRAQLRVARPVRVPEARRPPFAGRCRAPRAVPRRRSRQCLGMDARAFAVRSRRRRCLARANAVARGARARRIRGCRRPHLRNADRSAAVASTSIFRCSTSRCRIAPRLARRWRRSSDCDRKGACSFAAR